MQVHHFHNHNAYKHILVKIHSNLINYSNFPAQSISLGWKIGKYLPPLTIFFSGIPHILLKLIDTSKINQNALIAEISQNYFQANQLLPFLTARLSCLKRLKVRVQGFLGC